MHYGHSRKDNYMIKINHLTITQNKDLRDLVSDLSMTIQDGEKVAIIGEEGNGKSTLLRALMGEALPDFTIFFCFMKNTISNPHNQKTVIVHGGNSLFFAIFQ